MKTAITLALAAMFASAPVSLVLASGNDRDDNGRYERSERHESRDRDHDRNRSSRHAENDRHDDDNHRGRHHNERHQQRNGDMD